MAGILAAVTKNYEVLKREWEKDKCDLQKCGEILKSLKISLLNHSFLPDSPSGSKTSQQELLIARNTLEIGAMHAIATRDTAGFERYMSLLKCYYFDYGAQLSQSAYECELLGLNLLCLLCQDRLGDFHSELERLSEEQLRNFYIKHPISMEQYLMEGSYNKVFLSKGSVPSERYNYFMDILLNTTRDAIAQCMEAGYERIERHEAQRMLFFDNADDMEKYRQQREWRMDAAGREIVFQLAQDSASKRFPAEHISETMMQYAVELDRIV